MAVKALTSLDSEASGMDHQSGNANVYGGGGNSCLVPQTKDKKDNSDFYQQQVQRPGSVVVRDWISGLDEGHLPFCDGTLIQKSTLRFYGSTCHLQDLIFPRDAHLLHSWRRMQRTVLQEADENLWRSSDQ